MELTNITEDARKIFLKFCSINLCPTTIGQCMVDLMVKPPTPETCKDSYKVFKAGIIIFIIYIHIYFYVTILRILI